MTTHEKQYQSWLAKENPWHQFGQWKEFSSGDGSFHLTAFIDRRLAASKNKIGFVGHFSASSPEADVSSLRDAEAWLKSFGCQEVVGPVDFTMWHSHRFQISGETPTSLEPSNPFWYPNTLILHGYHHLRTYESFRRTDIPTLLSLIEPVLPQIQHDGFDIECASIDVLTNELQALYTISREAFVGEKGLVDLSWDEFAYLYLPMIKQSRASVYVARHETHIVGYLYTLRDPQRDEVLLMKTVAVLPDYQRKHLAIALACKAHQDALQNGITSVEYLLVRTGNNVNAMPYPGVESIRSFAVFSKLL